jgi:hypothetical protein
MPTNLKPFQRKKLRDIVGISTSFHDFIGVLSDRCTMLYKRLNEVKKNALVERQRIQDLRAFASNTFGLSTEARQAYLDSAAQMEQQLAGAQKEIEDEIQEIGARMEAMQIEAQPAARLADVLLASAGVDRELAIAGVFPRSAGGAA